MSIKFQCLSCNTLLNASTDESGSIVSCSNCQKDMIIPHVAPMLPVPVPIAGPPPIASKSRESNTSLPVVVEPEVLRPPTLARRKKLRKTLVPIEVAGAACFFIAVFIILLVKTPDLAPAPNNAQVRGIELIPAFKAILGNPSSERKAVERYALRNSLRPSAIHFDKWFAPKDASPDDDNAFKIEILGEDPAAKARMAELGRLSEKAPREFGRKAAELHFKHFGELSNNPEYAKGSE
jgi:hypothetical protein